jgi:hypothetical protein
MDYKQIYEKIMDIDPTIRLVTICDRDGNIMYTGHREGVKNLLTEDESKRSLELAVNSWKTRCQLESKIGKGNYVLAEYEKIMRITMQFDDSHLLFMTTESGAGHLRIINRIRGLSLP